MIYKHAVSTIQPSRHINMQNNNQQNNNWETNQFVNNNENSTVQPTNNDTIDLSLVE